jgi:putative acetyltransferase
MSTGSVEDASISIRPMRPEDAAETSRVIAAAVRSGFAGHYPPATVEALVAGNSPEALLAHAPKQSDYVLVIGDRIAAMIGLKRNEIGHLFVDPAHAGRGLGAELVAFAADLFRKAGHGDMVVLSSLNSAGFYARQGFVEDGRGSFAAGPGAEVAYVRMRRRLG